MSGWWIEVRVPARMCAIIPNSGCYGFGLSRVLKTIGLIFLSGWQVGIEVYAPPGVYWSSSTGVWPDGSQT